MKVRLGGARPGAAAALLEKAALALVDTDDRPPLSRAQAKLIRPRFRALVAATRIYAPKFKAAIDAMRAPFWVRSGLGVYREASSDELDDAELRKYLNAADAMSPYALEKALAEAYEQMVKQGIEHVRAEIDSTFDLRPDRAIAALDAFGDDWVGDVLAQEKAALKALIRNAFEEGIDPRTLAKEIADHFEDGVHRGDGGERTIDVDSWSQMVARTETARAQNAGALSGYQAAGVEQIIWVTADDERVCPRCEPLDGVVANVGENFPGTNVEHGPLHVLCRCGFVGLSDITRSLVRAA